MSRHFWKLLSAELSNIRSGKLWKNEWSGGSSYEFFGASGTGSYYRRLLPGSMHANVPSSSGRPSFSEVKVIDFPEAGSVASRRLLSRLVDPFPSERPLQASSLVAATLPSRAQSNISNSPEERQPLPELFAAGAAVLAGIIPLYLFVDSSPLLAKELAAGPLPKDIVLYQYETCPFCNKLKAFLDYYSIPYKVVEVNPFSKKEIKWSDYKKVPILVIDGKQLNDSSAIITELQAELNPSKAIPSAATDEEAKWRKWVDEHFVHLLAPNIYRSPTEALESFEYISDHGNFSTWERMTAKYFGAAAMYLISGRLKKKYNIGDAREDLYKAVEEWIEAVGPRKFLGGNSPNLADLAVYGVLQSVINVRTGKDLMEKTKLGPWYGRMKEAVGAPERIVE